MASPFDSDPNANSLAVFDAAGLSNILSESLNLYRAKLQQGTTDPKGNFVKVGPLALDTAPMNPVKLPSPMTSIILKDVTDDTVRVSLILNSDSAFAINAAYPMDHNEAINFSDPVPYAYLTWTAQPGKTATLYIGIDAEIKPGRIISVQSGGVTVVTGSGMTPQACLTVNAVTQLLTADSTRKKGTIQVLTGAGIYLSGVNTVANGTAPTPSTTTIGIFVPVGGTFEWNNAGACYAITDGTDSLVSINVES